MDWCNLFNCWCDDTEDDWEYDSPECDSFCDYCEHHEKLENEDLEDF